MRPFYFESRNCVCFVDVLFLVHAVFLALVLKRTLRSASQLIRARFKGFRASCAVERIDGTRNLGAATNTVAVSVSISSNSAVPEDIVGRAANVARASPSLFTTPPLNSPLGQKKIGLSLFFLHCTRIITADLYVQIVS